MITNTKVITIPCTECSWVFESYVPTYLVRFAIAIGVSTHANIPMDFNRSSFTKEPSHFSIFSSIPHPVLAVSASTSYILTLYISSKCFLDWLDSVVGSLTYKPVDEQMYIASYK